MNLQRRLKSLEKSMEVPDACARCGAPDRLVDQVIVTQHDRPLKRCAGCGRALDDHGAPLPRVIKRIKLLPENAPKELRTNSSPMP